MSERLVTLFEGGTCERFVGVQLAGCGLNDAHMYNISQHLAKAKQLQMLDISDNSNLSGTTLGYILDELPQLRDLLAVNCTNLLDDIRLQKLEQLKQLPRRLELTVDEQVFSMPGALETLQSIWQLQFGDKAKMLTTSNSRKIGRRYKGLLKLLADGSDAE